MKRHLLFLALFCCFYDVAIGQQNQIKIDSLKAAISKLPPDTNKALAYFKVASLYWTFKTDSAVLYINRAFDLSRSLKSESIQSGCLVMLGNLYVGIDYGKAIQYYLKARQMGERNKSEHYSILIDNNLASCYINEHDYKKAVQYLAPAIEHLSKQDIDNPSGSRKFKTIAVFVFENQCEVYLYLNQPDSAQLYLDKSEKYARLANFHRLDAALIADHGSIQALHGNEKEAIKYFKKAVGLCLKVGDASTLGLIYESISDTYKKFNQRDSAVYYSKKMVATGRAGGFPQEVLDGSNLLYKLYEEQHNIPQAYKYYKAATALKDSIFSQEKIREQVSLDFAEKQHQQELQIAQSEYKNRVRIYIFIAGLGVLMILAFVFWRNSRQRQRANTILQTQKEEIEQALSQLKAAQTQLIQSEKMASLGELTAGIAHEIQNPLNFVNNFSEVSIDLLAELKEEEEKGNKEDVLAITNDLAQNLQKIAHHGKRADSIVKGMLQHSRIASGQKEPTDMNALADEYMRLAYHGLRAKDKAFNAELVTHLDEELPRVNVVPQDMGRVMLNLFNNAFYAVNQKSKLSISDYKPVLEVSTAQQNGSVLISVKDNGSGIPDAIKDKILQPFFTTKPTGEGTGLGLSLSYDIVVKGHGGSINIDSRENQYTQFTISLPILKSN